MVLMVISSYGSRPCCSQDGDADDDYDEEDYEDGDDANNPPSFCRADAFHACSADQ